MTSINSVSGPYCDNALKRKLLLELCACSVVSDSLPPCGLQPTNLLCPWDFPGKNSGAGSRSLPEGIFPIQEWKPGLLHCRWILYCLSHQESPRILGFTQPRVASSYDLDGTATLGACSLVGIRVENRGPLASNLLYAIPSHCPCCTDPSSRAFDDAASSRESICTCLLWQPQPFLLLT